MNRKQLLAAETFHYSYAHYADHLGGNIRFDNLTNSQLWAFC
jgi:hypothetical protein